MTLIQKYEILLTVLSFLFFRAPCIGQTVQMDGLDINRTLISDTSTLHDFIAEMNREASAHRIKTKTLYGLRKNGKRKIGAREVYNAEGKLIYKVDFGWNKGRDSCTMHYTYDSIGRLIKTIRFNSIFGPKHEGTTFLLEYNKYNQVIKCGTDHVRFRFFYNSYGDVDSVETSRYHHFMYPSIRRPKTHVYDTTVKIIHFNYNDDNTLASISNSSGYKSVEYEYQREGKIIIKKYSSSQVKTERNDNGQIVNEWLLDEDFPSKYSIYSDSCTYAYEDQNLSSCECTSKLKNEFNYSYTYIYNDKNLLVEKDYFEENKKLSTTYYEYEYYP